MAKQQGPSTSEAAQRFLKEAKPAKYDESAANMPKVRATIREAQEPPARRALRRHKVKQRKIEIAGVTCLELIPPRHDDDRTILYFFGGAYITGSPREDTPISAALAAYTNARVISPAYRLAPEDPFPAAIDDGFAVYQTLMEKQPAGSLAISGESAGGNLALAVLQRARLSGTLHAAAVALLSPWCDLEDHGSTLVKSNDPTFHLTHLKTAIWHYAAKHDLAVPEISPLRGKYDESFPPMLLTSGTRDMFLSQVSRLARVLRRANVPVDLRVWEDMWHVFECYEGIPEADESLREIAAFLDDHFV